jgi:hypothetical protein
MKPIAIRLMHVSVAILVVLAVSFSALFAADQITTSPVFAAYQSLPSPPSAGQVAAITSANTLLLLTTNTNLIYLPLVSR